MEQCETGFWIVPRRDSLKDLKGPSERPSMDLSEDCSRTFRERPFNVLHGLFKVLPKVFQRDLQWTF